MIRRRLRAPARLASLVTLAAALLPAGACTQNFDVKAGLQVKEVSSGWFDAGIVEGGKNKLVPSISFKLENVASEPVSRVQLNANFFLAGADGELDSVLMQGIPADALTPGRQTPAITIRPKVGYTGEQPRAELLQHSAFRDASVKIFAKHGSSQWILLGEFPIERQLLTQ
jgi:hypothetical protein